MKHLLFLCLILFGFSKISQAQLLMYNYAGYYKVYVDGANVRQGPSLSSKVIGTLAHNSVASYCDGKTYKDTIGGVVDYWRPIYFDSTIAYIWGGVFANAEFRTHSDIEDIVLVDLSSNHVLGFKVFNNNVLKNEVSFNRPNKSDEISAGTIGKTYNSDGMEVFVVAYSDRSYELFNWDGKKIIESTVKLRDESFITNKVDTFAYCLIHGNNVNIRSQASVDSKVIATLPNNTYVKMIAKNEVIDTVNNQRGHWHKIAWKNQEAYVWTSFLALPIHYLKSNIEKDIDFLFTTQSIAVLRNGKIIDDINIPFNYNSSMLYELGNMGFKQNYNFIAKIVEGHGCGTDSGDDLYIWDGKKIKHFGYSYGIGDGAYSEGHSLTLPSSSGGIHDRVLASNYFGESLDIPSFEVGGENYEFVTFTMSNQALIYTGDTLIEVPSLDLSLRNLVVQEYRKHHLMHYAFGDINHDGYEDALFFCLIESDDYEEKPSSPIIGIAYGDANGDFEMVSQNTAIVLNDFSGVVLNIFKDKIQLKVAYNIGYSAEGNTPPSLSIFDFVYDTNDKQLYWYSITEAEAESQEYDTKWERKVSYFKTKKIRFDAAWAN